MEAPKEDWPQTIWLIDHLSQHPGVRIEQHYKSDIQYTRSDRVKVLLDALEYIRSEKVKIHAVCLPSIHKRAQAALDEFKEKLMDKRCDKCEWWTRIVGDSGSCHLEDQEEPAESIHYGNERCDKFKEQGK